MLGFGGRQRARATVTDLFNGFNTDGTYSGSAQAVDDYIEASRSVPANVLPVQGSRMVKNLLTYSDDISNAAWTLSGAAVKNEGASLTIGDITSFMQNTVVSDAPTTQHIFFVQMSGTEGDRTAITMMELPGFTSSKVNIALAANPTWYSVTWTPPVGTTSVRVRIGGNGGGAYPVTVNVHRAVLISNATRALMESIGTTSSASMSVYPHADGGVFTDCVAIGDSLTGGARDDSWIPSALDRIWGVSILDKGVGGNTLSAMALRWQADVLDNTPSSVVIEGGINDILGASSSPVATMQTKLQEMVDSAQSNGIAVVLFNLPPIGDHASWTATRQLWIEEYNEWLVTYSASQNIPLVNIYDALRDGINLRTAYSSGDGIHPNQLGNIYIAEAAAMALAPTAVPIWDALALRTRKGNIFKYAAAYLGYKNSAAASTNYTRSTANVLRPNNFAVWGRCVPSATGQATVNLWSARSDASNLLEVYMNATQVRFYKVVAGAFAGPVATYTHASGTAFEFQAYQSAAGMGIRVKEDGGEWSAWAETTDATSLLDAVIPASYQIGAMNNANHFAGNIPFIATVQHPDPKTEIERLSARYP